MTMANQLERLERLCQEIMLQVSQARGEELSELVHQFADIGNIHILRGLSSRLAEADAGEGVHRLAFPLIEGLAATQDPNVLTNFMAALAWSNLGWTGKPTNIWQPPIGCPDCAEVWLSCWEKTPTISSGRTWTSGMPRLTPAC